MTIKHISFDVWNTLITANPAYSYYRNKIIAEYAFITEERAATVYKSIKEMLDTMAENGVCGNAAYAWQVLGHELHMSVHSVSMMQRDCIEMFETFPPFFDPALRDALWRLSGLCDISIKSNTNFIPGSVVTKASGLDMVPFMFTHFSDVYQMCKPDPRFFKLTLDEEMMYDVNTEEVLHIGDNLICDGKCVDIGFNFCHISNPQDLLNKLEKGEIIHAAN